MERQYIGARYVPKFADPVIWNKAWSYEAMTIVTYLGNSFTSKKPVPAGIEIDNAEYWVNTGNYNAQVEAYRQETAFVKSLMTNVKKYGAVGDGVTDDSDAIQSAITNGKTVYIPYGTYLISKAINIPSDTTIYCDGTIKSTVQDANPSDIHYYGAFIAHNSKNIKIIGLNYIGSGAGQEYTDVCGVYLVGCSNVEIKGGKFTEIDGVAAICVEDSNYITVEGTLIDRYSYGGIISTMGGSCLNFNNNVVNNCVNHTSENTYGITLNSSYDGKAYAMTNASACGNIIKNEFPWWECIDSHGGKNITICNNVIINCLKGIACVNDMDNKPCYNVTICNNVIECATENPYNTSVGGTGIVAIVDNATIANNSVYNGGVCSTSGGYGISGNIYKAAITGNTFLNCQTWGFGSSMADCVVSGNIFTAANTAPSNSMCFRLVNEDCVNNLITNNRIENFAYLGQVQATTIDYTKPVRFVNNVATNYILLGTVTMALQDKYDSTPRFGGGSVGDVIMNDSVTTGKPIGWLCTQSATNSTPATWTALPNLS